MSYDFTFNASAIGVGGLLTNGSTATAIPSLASVALAPTGGEGFSEETNYNRHGVSFTKAESRVVGQKIAAGTYATYVDVLISNFAVRGRLKVGMMQASMTSIRNIHEDDSRFEFRASYRGLSIDDHEVVPELDLDLLGCSTYDDFRRRLSAAPADFAKRFGYGTAPALTKALKSQTRPAISGTLVKSLSPAGKLKAQTSIAITGHRILVPDFGSVNLAEFLFKPGRRRVSLVRIDFDERFAAPPAAAPDAAPVAKAFMPLVLQDGGTGGGGGGSLTGGSVEGNGSTIPPRI
ncbi:MAG: hypothetical protein JO197_07350 [Acidobacteria bacterium]|nr:hypothetical protein [Acidobacteriota bacterium]MBV9475794.1 hypothetical protein [Acidobacteriota bacterium]